MQLHNSSSPESKPTLYLEQGRHRIYRKRVTLLHSLTMFSYFTEKNFHLLLCVVENIKIDTLAKLQKKLVPIRPHILSRIFLSASASRLTSGATRTYSFYMSISFLNQLEAKNAPIKNFLYIISI